MTAADQTLPVYLDYNATTPIAPSVRAGMLPFIEQYFGNPSSDHRYGHEAARAVNRAREQVAALLNCSADEIVFTSGGSESDNWALLGRIWAAGVARPHVITTEIEHPAILNTCRFLECQGVDVTYLPVDGTGRVDPSAVRDALRPDTVVISIMHANNEVGTIQPLSEIAAICREAEIPFHSDAAQSVGKIRTDVEELGVDLLTLAGHKLYAPKGIGALYIRRGTPIEPLIHGAGHEAGRRAGTENVASIVGLGAAAELASRTLEDEGLRQSRLRDRLFELLAGQVAGTTLNGHPIERLPNTLNIRFTDLDGNALLTATPAVAAATGSACHAGHSEPSAVLLAMGIPAGEATGSVRLTLGRPTTGAEIEIAAAALAASALQLREGRLDR
ncbi:cysteine desulfurase family protein [Nitrolancea hollandica]|uniref:cysteine desulfurase n=1 Tax=Nitrolancea hollandica Lb TaxID=1129897 RepID=I4EKL4_9BACT|nr:cysteine desulfurase family protein [Nitrolancea hollandica]CCF85226.1 Cysteine desulfurase [Nitrolancea hollandica Lb]